MYNKDKEQTLWWEWVGLSDVVLFCPKETSWNKENLEIKCYNHSQVTFSKELMIMCLQNSKNNSYVDINKNVK